ncbi:MAG TPA: HAD family hydrolase [Chloroflexota bacterium]|nr:HAD family hydrolase [Chloroflexota bacterium]
MRAVFLDRDGVLNEAVARPGAPFGNPRSLDELRITSGAAGALQRLADTGFVLLGVTNQPEVRRGTTSRESVEAINARLLAQLPLTAFFVCWHDDPEDCACRKPKPGLILDAARAYKVDLGGSFMVGDRWKDVQAGRAAGCRTVLIDQGWAEMEGRPPADATVGTLVEAAAWILSQVGG